MEGRGASTATSNTAAIVDISTTGNGGRSWSGFRSHQHQSCGAASTCGSIHSVRRIPDLPVIVPSAALVSVSEETATEDVDMCAESEIDVDLPVVVPSAELVSVSEEPSRNVDVCEKSEIDIPVVADFGSLRNALGKESLSSEPSILSTDTEPEVVMLLPEVGLEDHVLQIRVGSENGTNAGGFEGNAHDENVRDEIQEAFVDGEMGSCAGVKVMDESTADLPVVFACLKSEFVPPSSGPLLAAPD